MHAGSPLQLTGYLISLCGNDDDFILTNYTCSCGLDLENEFWREQGHTNILMWWHFDAHIIKGIQTDKSEIVWSI